MYNMAMESKETDLYLAIKGMLPDYSVEDSGKTVTFQNREANEAKGLILSIKRGGVKVASLWLTTQFPGEEGLYHGRLEAFRSLIPREVRDRFGVDLARGGAEIDGQLVKCELEACCMALPLTEDAQTVAATIRYVLTGTGTEGLSFEKEGNDEL